MPNRQVSAASVYCSYQDFLRRPHVYSYMPYTDQKIKRLAQSLQFKNDMLAYIKSLENPLEKKQALKDCLTSQSHFLYVIFKTKSSTSSWLWKDPDQILIKDIQNSLAELEKNEKTIGIPLQLLSKKVPGS